MKLLRRVFSVIILFCFNAFNSVAVADPLAAFDIIGKTAGTLDLASRVLSGRPLDGSIGPVAEDVNEILEIVRGLETTIANELDKQTYEEYQNEINGLFDALQVVSAACSPNLEACVSDFEDIYDQSRTLSRKVLGSSPNITVLTLATALKEVHLASGSLARVSRDQMKRDWYTYANFFDKFLGEEATDPIQVYQDGIKIQESEWRLEWVSRKFNLQMPHPITSATDRVSIFNYIVSNFAEQKLGSTSLAPSSNGSLTFTSCVITANNFSKSEFGTSNKEYKTKEFYGKRVGVSIDQFRLNNLGKLEHVEIYEGYTNWPSVSFKRRLQRYRINDVNTCRHEYVAKVWGVSYIGHYVLPVSAEELWDNIGVQRASAAKIKILMALKGIETGRASFGLPNWIEEAKINEIWLKYDPDSDRFDFDK